MEEIFPGLKLDPVGFDLLMKMFIYDPEKRITASQALRHPYFAKEEENIPLSIDIPQNA